MKRAVLGVAVLVLGTAALVMPPTATEATWADREYATATIAALKVAAPVFGPTCTLSPGVLGADPVATFTWTVPTGYTIANTRMGIYNDLTGQWENVTGSPLIVITGTAPHYTTKFSGGLLSGLLGGAKTAGIQTVHSSGWASGWQSIHASMGLLGINPQCVVNSPPA